MRDAAIQISFPGLDRITKLQKYNGTGQFLRPCFTCSSEHIFVVSSQRAPANQTNHNVVGQSMSVALFDML